MTGFDRAVDRRGTACIKWDFQEMDYGGKSGLLPFSIADADYRTYEPIVAALTARVQQGIIGYTDVEEAYTAAVAGWCARRHGWTVQPDWIVPTGGIVPAMCHAIEALTRPGAGVIVQPPVYDPFYSVIQAAGRKKLENPLIRDEAGYRMDLEGLRRLVEDGAQMLLLCSPHNPVCRVWTREELAQVAAICQGHDIVIVSDEIHWDLTLGDREHVTMGQFGEVAEQLIVCTSCSKTFNIAGLETSNLIIPGDRLRDRYRAYLFARYLFVPNTLGMEAVKAAYADGDAWVDEQQAFLTGNAEIVEAYLREHLPRVHMAEPQGTYLLWLDMTAYGKSSAELVERIAQAGAGLNAGSAYGSGYDGFVRMNVACPRAQLRAGLDCIRRALEPIEQEGSV